MTITDFVSNIISLLLSSQLIGIVIGGLITYLTTTKLEKDKLQISDRQKRQEILSQLVGRRWMTKQLVGSHIEACIASDYKENLLKFKKDEDEKKSISQELKRLNQKREDLVLECAKNNQGLFEIIGLIQILFNNTPKLNDLIKQIYRFPEFEYTHSFRIPKDIATEMQLDNWALESLENLRSSIKLEIDNPLKDLSDYLASEIANDTTRKIHWWQFWV